MRKTVALLFLLFFPLVFIGCTTPMQTHWLNSRFYQSTQYFEQNLSPESANLDDLYYYCMSLYEIKNYEKFNNCHDTFFSRSGKVDNIGRTSRDALLAEIHSFKARNMIDLGADFDDIKMEIVSSLALLAKAPPNYHNGYKIPEIHVYETAGIFAAIQGDRTTALDYIGKIKAVTSMAEFQLRPIKNAAVAGIYFILKDYANAKKVIQEYSGSAFYAFAQALEVMMVFPLLVHYADVGTETSLGAWTERGTFLSEFMATKILFETGSLDEAKKGYERILSRKMSLDYERLHWTSLADLARIYNKEGRLTESISLLEQAVDLIENQRKTIFSEGSKIGFVGDKQAVYHDLIQALCEDRQYEKAFEYVERAKSRALVDLLASKKDFAYGGGDEKEIRALLETHDSAEMRICIPDASVDQAKTRSIQIKTREDLKNKAPELASLVSVTYQPVFELLSHISPEEALIEYYYRDKDLYAFILSDGGVQTVTLDGEGLTDDIRSLRKAVETPDSNQFLEFSKKLHSRIFQPIIRVLNKRSLIVVPHAALHYLPMNALHDGSGYLIDRYTIRMMPSASAMKYVSKKKADGAGGILIFGNPDLGDPRLDLAYAEQEAKEIAAIYPKSRVFLRADATEAALHEHGKNYRVLHFATHGQFHPDSPLKSALLLAPDSKYNGMLSVDKLYSLHLDEDLVTLSACETGLSQIANGDDLVGLTRGFLYAGASSIVASLWQVDDLATAQLMTRFYRELRNRDKAEALREAQLEIKKKYPHPYYWASFQLTGNAQ
ncbi:MAG: CHAT domain-containing protein [Deltaproteobacteria bacterium]|nr:CHAT domain-containing protein [Deltaproteobacteria bacterium]